MRGDKPNSTALVLESPIRDNELMDLDGLF